MPGGGSWSLAWGPAQDPSQANLAYVAVRTGGGQTLSVAVVVRGTDWDGSFLGLWNEIVEDLGADSQQAPPWPAPSDVLISSGTAAALTRVIGMTSGGKSLVDFLTGFYGGGANRQVPLQVTGHSLGACITTVLAPWLQAQLGQQGLSPAIVLTTYAGPTAGNQAFADAFRSAFPTAACYRNTLDVVPKAMADLLEILVIYLWAAGDGITFYNTGMRDAFIRNETIAVDKKKFRLMMKLFHGQVHRFERSFQDIDLIDLFMRYHGNCISQSFFLDESAQLVAVLFRYLFGIVQQGMKEVGGSTTAAATTGPARQPRPASSHPASISSSW